jgi:hypothetical protein
MHQSWGLIFDTQRWFSTIDETYLLCLVYPAESKGALTITFEEPASVQRAVKA